MTASLGDLLGRAHDHIRAAAADNGELPGIAWNRSFQELTRLIGGLARSATELDLSAQAELALRGHLDSPTRAVVETRLALGRAAEGLRQVTGMTGHPAGLADGQPCRLVHHLSGAADNLAAGLDLMQTHFISDPSGVRGHASYWAPVIASRELTLALASELAANARALAPCAAKLALAGPPTPQTPAAARLALHTTSKWLWVAGVTMQGHQPAPVHARLLHAIPANSAPARKPPTASETVADLCEGITITAERLRHAAQRYAPHARWAPATTSPSWRRAALGSAVTCHASQAILGTLTTRAHQLGLDNAVCAGLGRAAEAMHQAWQRWRTVVRHWDFVSTGVHPGTGPAPTAKEFADLALRAGRLGYRSPSWTPAIRGTRAIRGSEILVPDRSGVTQVLSAVHTSADALTRSALEDREAVLTAVIDRRLFVPNIFQPVTGRIHRRYIPARRSRTDAVLAAYDDAIRASISAAEALDELAITLNTPSAVLAAIPRRPIAPSHTPSRKPGRPWMAEQLSPAPRHPPAVSGVSPPPHVATVDQLATGLLTEAAAVTVERRETAHPSPPEARQSARQPGSGR